jgi:hypothetical protein
MAVEKADGTNIGIKKGGIYTVPMARLLNGQMIKRKVERRFATP